jgi:hypothetical protein
MNGPTEIQVRSPGDLDRGRIFVRVKIIYVQFSSFLA